MRFRWDQFDPDELLAAKGRRTVSVCIPARDEEARVGSVVASVARLARTWPLVDEIVVVDDGSVDATAVVAAAAGAKTVAAGAVLPELGEGSGKGEALWKSLYVASGDLLVFLDADLRGVHRGYVTGLLGPLLVGPAGVALVKATYDRTLHGVRGEGGRVTELMARPLLSVLFPALAGVDQPLGGEFAAPRAVLEAVPFVQGYGVDLALLLDVAALAGPDAVAQVDLGVRRHRNRTLEELNPQAAAVLATALRRAGLAVPGPAPPERPPMLEVAAYRAAFGGRR